MRDLVSPMWRTTWDAHGMVGNLTDVYTSRVYGCSPLPALVFTPHFLGTESWGLLVDSHGWITMWSTASRPPSSRRDRDAGPARDLGALSALARGGGAPRAVAIGPLLPSPCSPLVSLVIALHNLTGGVCAHARCVNRHPKTARIASVRQARPRAEPSSVALRLKRRLGLSCTGQDGQETSQLGCVRDSARRSRGRPSQQSPRTPS